MPCRKARDPYECPSCGYQTTYKTHMWKHFYNTTKPCPKTSNNIELTDEIKDQVLKYRKYYVPQQTETRPARPAIIVVDNSGGGFLAPKLATQVAKPKRKGIPNALRVLVWNTHYSEIIAQGMCWCCRKTITQQSFQCGHIVAHANGGPDTLANLKPVCSTCNHSIGNVDMRVFCDQFGFSPVTDEELDQFRASRLLAITSTI